MKPEYFVIIPAKVRYHKKLTPNSKIIFGEILCLSQSTGKCFATNKHFADLYGKSEASISKWINELKDEGFVKIEYDKSNNRDIEIVDEIKKDLKENFKTPIKEKLKTPLKENLKTEYTINSINNTSNNKTSNKPKKVYDELYLKCLKNIPNLFPERFRPETKAEKEKWLDVIEWADKKKKHPPRELYITVSRALNDDFWKKNFMSLNKLKSKNKDGIYYLDIFITKFNNKQ